MIIQSLLVISAGLVGAEQPAVLTTAEALALPRPEAEYRIAYGTHPLHFGELRLPDGPGPHPVAVLVHGGCWLAEYDLGYFAGLADALAGAGVATWSIEYRRVGDEGGGWPGTFSDVAAAADFLPEIAAEHGLDLTRVAAAGHSAGGHLALWLAARYRLEADDPLRGPQPLRVLGVVALAGIPDLAAYSSTEGCGAVVSGLLGGDPTALSHRLARTSPAAMLPLGVPVVMLAGAEDTIVPPSIARDFATVALEHGDSIRVRVVEGAGHFELSTPDSVAWPAVKGEISDLLQAD